MVFRFGPAHHDAPIVHDKERWVLGALDNGQLKLTLKLPWVTRGDLDITRVDSELILNVGGFKKHVELPRAFAGARPVGARIDGETVTIRFEQENGDGKQE